MENETLAVSLGCLYRSVDNLLSAVGFCWTVGCFVKDVGHIFRNGPKDVTAFIFIHHLSTWLRPANREQQYLTLAEKWSSQSYSNYRLPAQLLTISEIKVVTFVGMLEVICWVR